MFLQEIICWSRRHLCLPHCAIFPRLVEVFMFCDRSESRLVSEAVALQIDQCECRISRVVTQSGRLPMVLYAYLIQQSTAVYIWSYTNCKYFSKISLLCWFWWVVHNYRCHNRKKCLGDHANQISVHCFRCVSLSVVLRAQHYSILTTAGTINSP